MMKKLVTIIFLMLTIASCEHKELCYTHPHGACFDIQYDWSRCEVDDIDVMRIMAYPLGGGLPLTYYIPDMYGGELVIQSGGYNLLSFNNNTEAILFTDENSIETITAYLHTTTITEGVIGVDEPELPDVIQGQDLVITPDDFYSTTYENLISGIDSDTVPVTLVMNPLVRRVSYEVHGIGNVHSIKLIKGALGGVSASVGVANGNLSVESSAVIYGGAVSEDGVLSGEFNYLGVADNMDKRWMVLFLWGDGGNLRAAFDVTEQIATAANPYDVKIIIETDIYMPEAISGDGGFSPSVNDWEESEDDNEMIL